MASLLQSCSAAAQKNLHKPSSTSPAEKSKKKIKRSKKKLEALLTCQNHLVEEKGLPPSRLMLEQAALANSASTPVQMPDQKETDFIGEL